MRDEWKIILPRRRCPLGYTKRFSTGIKIICDRTMLECTFEKCPQRLENIKIKTSAGVVLEVEGMPDGYQYEVIECDKCGEPLPPEDDQ